MQRVRPKATASASKRGGSTDGEFTELVDPLQLLVCSVVGVAKMKNRDTIVSLDPGLCMWTQDAHLQVH